MVSECLGSALVMVCPPPAPAEDCTGARTGEYTPAADAQPKQQRQGGTAWLRLSTRVDSHCLHPLNRSVAVMRRLSPPVLG